MNVQIPGWKWFPLLKGETPTEPSEARRGDAIQPVVDGERPEAATHFGHEVY